MSGDGACRAGAEGPWSTASEPVPPEAPKTAIDIRGAPARDTTRRADAVEARRRTISFIFVVGAFPESSARAPANLKFLFDLCARVNCVCRFCMQNRRRA